MATWREMGEDNLKAARKLLAEEHYRSSVTRSYYAVYCLMTSELVKRGASFPRGWNNPAHDQLPDMVLNNTDFPQNIRRRLRQTLVVLRRAREDADYRPTANVGRDIALEGLRRADAFLRDLERTNGRAK